MLVDSESEVIGKDQGCEISFRWFVFPLVSKVSAGKPHHFFSALFQFHFHVILVGHRRDSTLYPIYFVYTFIII